MALVLKHSYWVTIILFTIYMLIAHFFGRKWYLSDDRLDQDLLTAFQFGGIFHLIISLLFGIVAEFNSFQMKYLIFDPFSHLRSPRLPAFASTVMLPISIIAQLMALLIVFANHM